MKLLCIGEKINSSRKEIKRAIERSDKSLIQKIAREQAEAGAHYLDVNAGLFMEREPEKLRWIVETVQKVVDRPCCLDSPNPLALEAALKIHRGQALLNSISLEKERYHSILPLVRKFGTKIVALCLDDGGMPKDAEDRFRLASMLIERLTKEGIAPDDIYVDPLVQPMAIDHSLGPVILDSIGEIKTTFPEVHLICGLSNISFGLPQRKLLNQVFLVLALAKGLDAAILDPTDPGVISCLNAAQVLLGADEFCSNYLEAFRHGRLNF